MDSTRTPITVWMVSLRGAVTGTALAAVYAVSVSVAALDVRQTSVTEPASVRHRWFIAYVAAKAKDPNARRSSSPFDTLSPAELLDQLALVLRDLEADLRSGKLSPHQAYATFEALGTLGPRARPAVPTIIAVIDAWDHDQFFRIPYLCEAVKSLGKIAPTSPDVINLLAKKLAGELPSRGSVCHRCGCILEALEQSGSAAREIAGPVLQRVMAEPGFMTTYDWQLGRAVKAIGIGGGSTFRTALARAAREDVLPGDRAAIFRALAKDAPGYSDADLDAFHRTAAGALGSTVEEVRAAAEALGAAGARAVPDLVRALTDWHYIVRLAAVQSLGRLGPSAEGAAQALVSALDPFLGTGGAAAEALVTIGPAALPAIERRRPTAPPHLTAFVAATSRAVRERRVTPIRESLSRDFTAGPHGQGFVRVDVQRAGAGQTPFDPQKHRLSLRFTVQRYDGPGRFPERTTDSVVAHHATNNAIQALRGRRAGDTVRLLLSPDIAQSLAYATNRHAESGSTHVPGTPGLFEATITRVCEPVIWTLWKGHGLWGPIEFETYCRN
jgi:hypothetical protein